MKAGENDVEERAKILYNLLCLFLVYIVLLKFSPLTVSCRSPLEADEGGQGEIKEGLCVL